MHHSPPRRLAFIVARSKECRKDFSVTTKSVMESSHIKLNVWLQAFFLMASSKKGMSSHQLHRALGITYKSAWFLTHRIREAMRAGGLVPPLGGEGKVVEADETYFGPVAKSNVRTNTTVGRAYTKGGRSGPSNKRAIVSLVERGGSCSLIPCGRCRRWHGLFTRGALEGVLEVEQDAAPAAVSRTHRLGRPGVSVRAHYGALPSMAGRGQARAAGKPAVLKVGESLPPRPRKYAPLRQKSPRWRA